MDRLAVLLSPTQPHLGLRANWPQFSLLVLVNAFVGGMAGIERSILPAIAEGEFDVAARTAILAFIVAFGLTKAPTNYFAGRLADRFGRKRVLVAGWLIAVPVPWLLMYAQDWEWIVAANVLLGVSQGLTWSTTLVMKFDLAGPRHHGLAAGLNEFAGYLAVAASAYATARIAQATGLRPEPFYPAVAYAAIGLLLSAFVVRETRGFAAAESALQADNAHLTPREVFRQTSFADRTLSSVSQAGFANNFKDAIAWGLLPLWFAAQGMGLERIGVLAAIYPATWGVLQLAVGTWSDRAGRKRLIVAGLWIQAVGMAIILLPGGMATAAAGSALLGVGTALAYPTLLAAVGDVAEPSWRASALGVYRLWRDLGYVFGGLLAGLVADWLGMGVAIAVTAVLTFVAGTAAAVRMRETLARPG